MPTTPAAGAAAPAPSTIDRQTAPAAAIRQCDGAPTPARSAPALASRGGCALNPPYRGSSLRSREWRRPADCAARRPRRRWLATTILGRTRTQPRRPARPRRRRGQWRCVSSGASTQTAGQPSRRRRTRSGGWCATPNCRRAATNSIFRPAACRAGSRSGGRCRRSARQAGIRACRRRSPRWRAPPCCCKAARRRARRARVRPHPRDLPSA